MKSIFVTKLCNGHLIIFDGVGFGLIRLIFVLLDFVMVEIKTLVFL